MTTESSTTHGTTDAWVRTRLCYCEFHAATDCRFHDEKEPGWEVCPSKEQSLKDNKSTGRWLWARNPNFGGISEAAGESTQVEP